MKLIFSYFLEWKIGFMNTFFVSKLYIAFKYLKCLVIISNKKNQISENVICIKQEFVGNVVRSYVSFPL